MSMEDTRWQLYTDLLNQYKEQNPEATAEEIEQVAKEIAEELEL